MIVNWIAIGQALLRIGQAVGTPLLAALVAGKTLRSLLYRPIHWITGKTATVEDDKIAETIREDWELPADKEEDGPVQK